MPVIIEHFESVVLANNPLGDSTHRTIPVYLPPGYEGETDRRYPVLFALAGFTGTGLSYLNYNFYSPSLPQQLDQLIGSGKMAPCIVVMVDGMTALGGNQYIDSTAVGPWATHICEELVPWAETRFRCLGGREHRGVFGKSSGGYGSMMMGLERSETWGAIASHSGDCYFPYCYIPDFPRAIDAIRRGGGLAHWAQTWRNFDKLPGWAFPGINIVAMSHFYSPAPSDPRGFELPFDLETGVLDDKVFARWRSRDPAELIASRHKELASLRLFFLDCGDRDEYQLHHGARLVAQRIEAVGGVALEYQSFSDNHRGLNYRYNHSLPLLARAVS